MIIALYGAKIVKENKEKAIPDCSDMALYKLMKLVLRP